MAISAVSSSSAIQAVQHITSANQNAQNLQRALSSGNISGAQAAFSQLQKQLPTFGGQKGPGVGNAPPADQSGTLKQDLQSLQDALAAGDVPGAQNAFTKLKADLHEIDPPKAGAKISQSADAGNEQTEVESASAENSEVESPGAQQRVSINVYA